MSTHVSFPLFLPFIIAASLFVGGHIVGGSLTFENETMNIAFVKEHLFQYIVGSSVLAVVSSISFGLLTFLLLKIIDKQNNSKN